MKGITKRPFGTTKGGMPVTEYIMENARGEQVSALDFGCTLHAVRVLDRTGALRDVCTGYRTLQEYEDNGGQFGATIGRHANRIGGARFMLGGKEYPLARNNGDNHIHGGPGGFSRLVWRAEPVQEGVAFSLDSPDGDEGYPGALAVTVTVTLSDAGALTLDYRAVSDRDTILNMTNHAYFNLEGEDSGSVLTHTLRLDADAFTPAGEGALPTGEIRPVVASRFFFTTPTARGRDSAADDAQLKAAGGYDHNFVLRGEGLRTFARLEAPTSGIVMEAATDLPGVQLFTANSLSGRCSKSGKAYVPHGAVCLETQFFPNSTNCPNFPSIVLRGGDVYHHVTVYAFHTV